MPSPLLLPAVRGATGSARRRGRRAPYGSGARAAFASMGSWAIVLMLVVCSACAFSAVGLWRGEQWGFLAIGVLTINLKIRIYPEGRSLSRGP